MAILHDPPLDSVPQSTRAPERVVQRDGESMLRYLMRVAMAVAIENPDRLVLHDDHRDLTGHDLFELLADELAVVEAMEKLVMGQSDNLTKAKAMREYAEWLDSQRNADVGSQFHTLIAWHAEALGGKHLIEAAYWPVAEGAPQCH